VIKNSKVKAGGDKFINGRDNVIGGKNHYRKKAKIMANNIIPNFLNVKV